MSDTAEREWSEDWKTMIIMDDEDEYDEDDEEKNSLKNFQREDDGKLLSSRLSQGMSIISQSSLSGGREGEDKNAAAGCVGCGGCGIGDGGIGDCGYEFEELWQTMRIDDDDYDEEEEEMWVSMKETHVKELETESERSENENHLHNLTNCQICLEVGVDLLRRPCCQFSVCHSCFKKYLTYQIDDGNATISCPNYNCRMNIPNDDVFRTIDVEARVKFYRFFIRPCPDAGCKMCPGCNSITVVSEKLLEKKKVKVSGLRLLCPVCQLQWCFNCHTPWQGHKKRCRTDDDLLKIWAKKYTFQQANARKCPKCKIYIQKISGCDHMTCTRCGTLFCYNCGGRRSSVEAHRCSRKRTSTNTPSLVRLLIRLTSRHRGGGHSDRTELLHHWT